MYNIPHYKFLGGVILDSWNKLYECACTYYYENGNLNVPKNYITSNGYNLGIWIVYQKSSVIVI